MDTNRSWSRSWNLQTGARNVLQSCYASCLLIKSWIPFGVNISKSPARKCVRSSAWHLSDSCRLISWPLRWCGLFVNNLTFHTPYILQFKIDNTDCRLGRWSWVLLWVKKKGDEREGDQHGKTESCNFSPFSRMNWHRRWWSMDSTRRLELQKRYCLKQSQSHWKREHFNFKEWITFLISIWIKWNLAKNVEDQICVVNSFSFRCSMVQRKITTSLKKRFVTLSNNLLRFEIVASLQVD